MSPERQRWLAFVRAAKSGLTAIEEEGVQRLHGHDRIVLALDEMRDLAQLIAACQYARATCDRLSSSLGDDAD